MRQPETSSGDTLPRARSLDVARLSAAYADGELTPSALVEDLLLRLEAAGDHAVWISRFSDERLRERGAELDALLDATPGAALGLPLFGIPVAIKDNIDVEGLPTTAGCPGYAYEPARSATVVQKLVAAGAMVVGKANLDQFATGLVGTRSPYGVARNAFDPRYVPGGSSSGSAVAVASGLVSLSLGTDTAGSGRVPAAFGNVVGLKPTPGLVSAHGTVPACRSLDCVSVFALTCEDARRALRVIEGFDAADAYSRRRPATAPVSGPPEPFRFGVLRADQLEFSGDTEAERLHAESVAHLEALGGRRVEIDYAPFQETAELLYLGPWVAERTAVLEPFMSAHPDKVHPVTLQVVSGGARFSAVDTFRGLHRLEELRRETAAVWEEIDILVVPTTPTIPTVAELEADPIGPNLLMGHYTNFVNFLGLSALALPAGFRADGLPLGTTLIGPGFHDDALAALGARFQRHVGLPLGATGHELPAPGPDLVGHRDRGTIRIAVFGAHLAGEPLHHQLADRGARLVSRTRTAPAYRLHALDDARPGLVAAADGHGVSIETEVWELPAAGFGECVAEVTAPLVIGTVVLEDGTTCKGFLCEEHAARGARDISEHGGWRGYRATAASTRS